MKKLVFVGAGELTGGFKGDQPWLKPVQELEDIGFEVWFEKGIPEDAEKLAAAWALIPSRVHVTEEFLDKAPNLKLIAKPGVGLDRINIPACTERGICVANSPEANRLAVAEHTMALMLAAAKNLYPISQYIRNDYPDFACSRRYRSMEFYGKTIAIIGVGRIGTRVAHLAYAFDMKVVGWDPYIDHSQRPDFISWPDTLEEALAQADVVSIHVSAWERNRGFIAEKELAAMKETAILVNTARGYVVKESALYEALRDKRIGAAGLDVFEVEPFKPCNPIMHLENFVCTPHSAASTKESGARAMFLCAKMIKEYAEGIVPDTAANDVVAV